MKFKNIEDIPEIDIKFESKVIGFEGKKLKNCY
jgi:hypothetical protein